MGSPCGSRNACGRAAAGYGEPYYGGCLELFVLARVQACEMWRIVAFVALLFTAVGGCGGKGENDVTPGASSPVSRSAHSFEGPWPFTVARGTLDCRGDSTMIITFQAGSRTYAINDAARKQGYASPQAILKPGATLEGVVQQGEGLCAIGVPGGG
jgi:hypothetical protein